MSDFVCSLKSMFRKKTKGLDMTDEVKQKVADNMNRIAREYFRPNPKYKNIQNSKRNDYEHFEFLWGKYSGFEVFDPSIMPPTMVEVRKFELGLGEFEAILGKKQGIVSAALKLPKAQLRSLPELKKFGDSLQNETSFFREYNIDTTKKINGFLIAFQKLTKGFGTDTKTLERLEGDLNTELKINSKLTGSAKSKSDARINELQKKFREFYAKGAGDGYLVMTKALQGMPVNENMDLKSGRKLNSAEQSLLKEMVSSFDGIRKRSVPLLVKALERLASIAKDRNLPWADKQIDVIRGHIRQIEFNAMQTDSGPVSDPKAFKADEFLMKGLKFIDDASMHDGGKVRFKHYMPKYTLGILSRINTLEKDIMERRDNPSEQLKMELDKTDALINRVKGESQLEDYQYSVNPYFFLKKYAGDVALFNYKAHVKHTFREAYNALVKDHMEPAKEAGNQDVIDATESWLKNLQSIHDALDSVEQKRMDTVSNDLVRAMTSLTYFRLLGGNVRSAARNKTQRLYEFVEFGLQAVRDGRAFFETHADAENNKVMAERQSKIYGLAWFNGKTVTSRLMESLTGEDANLSATSRGALEESFFAGKGISVDENGEIVLSTERFSKKAARAASNIASKTAFMHRVVEDSNRSGTFRIAFALAHMNLTNMPDHWKAKKMAQAKGGKAFLPEGEIGYTAHETPEIKWVRENPDKVEAWVEATAGRMAYNSAVDLHFEYSAWNKAKALKTKKGKIFGQFLHYRFSLFDLMHKWVTDGIRATRAGDLKFQASLSDPISMGEEMWKPLRFAILTSMLSVGSSVAHMNFQKLFNNDVLESGEIMYSWLTTDRDNPEEVEKLERKTYGQGLYYFLGPNVNYALSMKEMRDVYFADHDTAKRHTESLQHLDDRTKVYKATAMINSQAARFLAYTWPVGIKQGIIPAAQLELGQFESKEQRATRNLAFGWFEDRLPRTAEFLGIKSKSTGSKKKWKEYDFFDNSYADQSPIMSALDLLQQS